jgi:hypothetical protein
MRQMSFALTTEQIRNRTKTVTRRLGWENLTPLEHLQAIKQGQGLKKGETVEKLRIIIALDVRREPLRRMVDEPEYGALEVKREGFAGHPEMGTPEGFVAGFCQHNGCEPETIITRIEFDYV